MDTQTDQKLDVSIIIVSYNHFDLLENCLRSLIEKTVGLSYEIIIVDNSTESNVEATVGKFPGIKLIKNNTNSGFASANNQGAAVARGKYLLILNNDVIFTENTLLKVWQFTESQNQQEVIVGVKLLNYDGSMQESVYWHTTLWYLFTESFFLYKIFPKSKYFNKYYQNYYGYSDPTETKVVRGAFLLISKEAFNKLNGFDESFFFYSEEMDLCYRFSKSGGKVYYYPRTSLIHLGSASSVNNKWFLFKNLSKGKIQFCQKHFSGVKFFIAIIIHYLGILLRIPVYLLISIIKLSKFNLLKSYYYLRTLFVYPQNKFK